MKDLLGIFFNDWSYAFGWTLLHSLWQCLIILLIVLACLRIIPGMRSSLRYVVGCCGFLLMIVASVATFFYESYGNSSDELYDTTFSSTQVNLMISEPVATSPDIFSLIISVFESNMPVFIGLWTIGFLFCSLRLAGGFYYSWKIRSSASVVEGTWDAFVSTARQKLGIHRLVSLGESVNINTPVVIGYVKPVILLPVGMLSGLTTEQLETIILHELAHIKRNDYLVNFIQTIFETLFFFNPFVRILSKEIRKEREYCCDDIVIRNHGAAHAYASALVQVAEARLSPSAFAMALADDKNQLLNRIKRIMERSVRNYSVRGRIAIPVLLMLGGLLCISWLGSGRKDIIDNLPTAAINDTIPEKKENVARYSRKSIITLDENGQPHEEIVEEFEGDESLRPLMKMHVPAIPQVHGIPDAPAHVRPGARATPLDTIPPAPFGLRNKEGWEAFSRAFEDHFRTAFEDLRGRLDGDSTFLPPSFGDGFPFGDLESFRIREEALKALEDLERSETFRNLDEQLQHLDDLQFDDFRAFGERFDMRGNAMESYEDVLRENLEKDGYISADEPIESLEWNNESFKVNGKSIKETDRQKYRELNEGFFKPKEQRHKPE